MLEVKIKVDNNWLKVGIIVVGLLCIVLFSFILSSFSDNKNDDQSIGNCLICATTPYMPSEVSFCGEKVPLQYFDVRESLERELIVNAYYHSQTILLLKKAHRFFSVVEPILRKNDVPDDFKYLMVAESGFVDFVSPAGAAGQWHFLKTTAKQYGLEVDDEVDERYNLAKATQAACEYFKDSYQIYKNWTLVAASYNGGRKGVDRQIQKQGDSSYYNLAFVEETARYVYRIIALKLVMQNPEKYGFHIPKSQQYPLIPCDTVAVDSTIPDLAVFAKDHGTNYKILKFLNPWLRDSKLLNPHEKEYVIRVPKKGGRELY